MSDDKEIYMTTQIVCDACGKAIDQTQPFYQVTATKVQVNNADDPSLPNEPVTVEITQQFDYHNGHQPQRDAFTPEHPIVEPDEEGFVLTSIDPTTVPRNSSKITLRALGTGFTDTAKIVFNNNEMTTAFISATELTCEINTAISANPPGSYNVFVRQDGTSTDGLTFTIT